MIQTTPSFDQRLAANRHFLASAPQAQQTQAQTPTPVPVPS